MITQQQVKSIFIYDHKSGIITNRIKRSSNGGANQGAESGSLNNMGYLITGIKGKNYLIHRIAFLY